MKNHISFSELKIWNECPYKHKLVYLDKVENFVGNEHTAFGTAMHYVCENAVTNEKTDLLYAFNTKFLEELKLLIEKKVEIKKDLVEAMKGQGKKMINHILPALKSRFKNFEVVSVEEMLYEPIDNKKTKFKGYIDLVIKTPDDKYHVIDWKTCSWGWDSRKKTDRMVTYQLTLYKYYFAKKHDIDIEKISTYFALLKRTAKSNNVEIFEVPNGKIKTKNVLNLLDGALYNIEHGKFIKNRLSCTRGYGCEFYKTEHCK